MSKARMQTAAWWALGLALALWLAGDAIWILSGEAREPFPGRADAFSGPPKTAATVAPGGWVLGQFPWAATWQTDAGGDEDDQGVAGGGTLGWAARSVWERRRWPLMRLAVHWPRSLPWSTPEDWKPVLRCWGNGFCSMS